MNEPNPQPRAETSARPEDSEEVRAALLARLARIRPAPANVRPPQSLQPTPEAAKTRRARLRRKQRALLQITKRTPGAQQDALPAAPDPLAS